MLVGSRPTPRSSQSMQQIHERMPHVAAFLPGWDKESLRQVNKDVRKDVLSGIHEIKIRHRIDCSARDTQALIRLLQQTPTLTKLRLHSDSLTGTEVERLLVEAIGSGLVGDTLTHLQVPTLHNALLPELMIHLKCGRLPKLKQLEVPPLEGDDARPLGAALAHALETRKEINDAKGGRLVSPTDIDGIWGLDVEYLRRIWACCEAKEVANLEAKGGP